MDGLPESQCFIGAVPGSGSSLSPDDCELMFPIYEKNFTAWLPESKDAPILDFGCGYGTFLQYLAGLGYCNLSGVDPDPRCAAIAGKMVGAKIVCTADTAAFLEQNRGAFQQISAFSVVGYFEREEVLHWFQCLRAALRSDGRLLLDVNNSVGIFGSVDFIQDPYFRSQYTDVSLRDILNASGFEVLEIHGIRFPAKGPFRAAWLLAQFLWRGVLRLILVLERGVSERNPRVFQGRIIVVARPRPRGV